VSIEADQYSFQAYQDGIYDDQGCGTTLDHAVLLVGWGEDAASGKQYYIMKNSWGTTWGDNGYMKMAITGNDAGICGV